MRDIFSKEGILFLVQIDHLSGEIFGAIFDCLYTAGALNVQCLSTVTKKNRPGNVFLIDVRPEKADAIEKIIINELGSTGWHKILTDHRHVPVESVSKDIEVVHDSYKFKFSLKGKRIKGVPESIRPEHSCCLELKEKLRTGSNLEISLKLIYMKVQTALWQEEPVTILF